MILKMASVHQIKERLLKVFDKDGSVANSSAALEIVVMLENTKVTKDELEATRLGKIINDVRRAAKDPSLQKRAKKLIKTWQQLISSPMPTSRSMPQIANVKTSKKQSFSSSSIKNSKSSSSLVTNKSNGGIVNIPNSSKRKADVNSSKTSRSESTLKLDSKSSRSTLAATSKSKSSFKEPSSASQPSFTCMTNGLKLTITTLPSSTPSRESISSSVSEERANLKRRRHEEDSTKSNVSLSRTSNLNLARTLPQPSLGTTVTDGPAQQKPTLLETQTNFRTRSTNPTKLPPESNIRGSSSSSSIESFSQKSGASSSLKEMAPSSDVATLPKGSLYGTEILHRGSPPEKPGEMTGIDGNRLNNGKFYPWSECLPIKHLNFEPLPEETVPDDILVILPYVELE